MKNLFESDTVNEILSRIDKLQPASPRQWGKMDSAQMLAHCSAAMAMATAHGQLPLNLALSFFQEQPHRQRTGLFRRL